MKCEQVKGSLSACLDSQLALEEREAIATHLLTCKEWNNVLVDFRYFSAVLSNLLYVVPNVSLQQKKISSAEHKEITGTCELSTVSDEQQGISLRDALHDTFLQLDLPDACSPILWTQFPWFSVDRKV
jgi:hypothetical protein